MWGLLADEDRRRVFAALVLGAETLEELAERTGLALPAVWRALRRLRREGVVDTEGDRWQVQADVIAQRAREAAPEPEDVGEGVPPKDAAVLRSFLRDGRLTSIPTARSKRLVVLDHLVRVFEAGVRYPEREVNALLAVWHPDVAALRRYLVDEGLLTREAGVYWRSGGWVDV